MCLLDASGVSAWRNYMSEIRTPTLCPCGSQLAYNDCCGRFIIQGHLPATAEQLMRSRYSAFVLGDEEYLLASWHPQTRPSNGLALEHAIEWLGLQVLHSENGRPADVAGHVEVIARYKINGRTGKLHENSRFENLHGRWLYVDGQQKESDVAMPSRNQPCPCGSGKKYKRCCAK